MKSSSFHHFAEDAEAKESKESREVAESKVKVSGDNFSSPLGALQKLRLWMWLVIFLDEIWWN